MMKLRGRIITAGIALGVFIACVLIARLFTPMNKQDNSASALTITSGSPSVLGSEEHQAGKEKLQFKVISMTEAATLFKTPGNYVILDVRTAGEYAQGHIPGAVNVPNEEIGSVPPAQLPNPEQAIYVYCRSGRRSREASAKLAALGYKNVYDFGGITDWTGAIEQ